jgi:hypothetical protein
MENEMLEQNLKCPICLTTADEPVESSCCGHIFCSKCVKTIKHLNCPICRSNNIIFRQNSFVRNLLNTLQVKCPYGCSQMIILNNVKIHRMECEEAIFKCTIYKCKFEGNRTTSEKHFVENHSDQMVILAENYASLKNTFDKHPLIEKLLKNQKQQREMKINIMNINDINKRFAGINDTVKIEVKQPTLSEVFAMEKFQSNNK